MHRQLEEYLDSIDRNESYRVDATLKTSDAEVTQRVYFQGRSGSEQGPYIRKIIQRSNGLGQAYERIWTEQQKGKRFVSIPRIVECFTTESALTVVMEYIQGQTLADLLYESDPSLDVTKRVFPLLCDAIQEIHFSFDPPLIHRDLKPSNIMLTENGLVLIDFGIARSFKDGAEEDTTHFGTKGYAPPEQFGFGQTSVRSDIYAMGMILYYCLVEETPSSAIRENEFADERIPAPLQEVIRKATAFDPAARYGSVSELRNAFIEAVQDHEATLQASKPVSEKASVQQAYAMTSNQDERRHRIGRAWNIALLVVWILFLGVTTDLIIEPSGSMAEFSLLGRIISGYGIFGLGMGCLVYLFSDKQWIKARVPQLAQLSRPMEIILCVVLAFIFAFLSTGIAVLIS